MAAAARRRAGGEAAAPRAAPGGPAAGRRGRDRHDDRGARGIEREGEARARLAAAARELARGLRRSRGVSEQLEELRPVAFGVAYRMLGSVAEAEDVVQEA